MPLPTTTLISYLEVLDTSFGEAGPDGLLRREDRQAILHSPDAPASARESARSMLENPGIFDWVDGVAQGDGHTDQIIGQSDLELAALRSPPFDVVG